MFADGLTSKLATITGLTPGTYYDIVVSARNLIGSSLDSSKLTVLAAQIPDAPINLANDAANTNSAQIGLTWDPPTFDGGSSVLDYSIWSDDATGTTFTEHSVGITSTSATITGLSQGSTY